MTATAAAPPTAGVRSLVRTVGVPTEHGGWGLTLEPAVLGLVVAPSGAGAALAVAALVAFLARAPLKVALIDRWRHRRLHRTVVAERLAVVELAILAVLAVAAFLLARGAFWVPLVVAAPLVAVELWFDMRSRSRRLVPEVAGAIGMASVVAAIVLAGGGDGAVAVGCWMVLAARSVAAVPFVRLQIQRLRQRPHRLLDSDGAQLAALTLAAGAAVLDGRMVAGFAAVTVLAFFHSIAARRPPGRVAVLGAQETLLGVTVVAATAIGVLTT